MVSLLHISSQLMHCLANGGLCVFHVYVSFVYGFNTRLQRLDLWKELIDLSHSISFP